MGRHPGGWEGLGGSESVMDVHLAQLANQKSALVYLPCFSCAFSVAYYRHDMSHLGGRGGKKGGVGVGGLS